MTDEELMLAVSRDNDDAFSVLYEKYKDRIYSFIRTFVHDINILEDIFQDTFLSIYKNRKSYTVRSKFSTYVFAVVRSKCINHLRKLKYHADLDENDLRNHSANDVNFHKNAIINELQENFNRMVNGLDEKKKTALFLRDVNGQSYEEIAEIMGQSLGSVKTLIHRARKQIYEKLRKEYA